MKAMLAGFAVMAVLSVGAWLALNGTFDYTDASRTSDAVRLD